MLWFLNCFNYLINQEAFMNSIARLSADILPTDKWNTMLIRARNAKLFGLKGPRAHLKN